MSLLIRRLNIVKANAQTQAANILPLQIFSADGTDFIYRLESALGTLLIR